MKKYKIKVKKPNMAYAGSLMQQNFGEKIKKGFLQWDIYSKNNWDVKFVELDNPSPFITIPWQGDVNKTIEEAIKIPSSSLLEGARFRISSSQAIPSIQTRKVIYELKEKYNASEVKFKFDLVSKMEHFTANDYKISKKGLRKDPDAVVKLYLDYIKSHVENYKFNKEQLDEAEKLIRDYMCKLIQNESDNLTTDVNWTIKSFEFDNLYRYGEENIINFANLEGIVGIFGNNATGKSSVIGALMYTLFNTTDRGAMKNAFIINSKKKYGKGKIHIAVGTEEYIIERQSARVVPRRKTRNTASNGNKTNTTVNLFKLEKNEETGEYKKISKNSISRDETDKKIRQIIGTSNDFLLTAFSSQGRVDNFIKEGPTERKNILSRFLELDIFKKLEELVKKDYNTINVRTSLFSAESLISQIKTTRKDINNFEKTIEILDERIKKLQSQKDEINLWLMHHEKNAAEVDIHQLDELEKHISDNEKKIVKKSNELKDINENINKNTKNLKAVIEEKKHINVSELKQQVEDLEDVKATLNEIKYELSTQENKLNTQKKNVKKLDLVPCGDKFPECHYIKDAHRDKKRIKKQEELVTTLSKQVDCHQKKLNEYIQRKIKETIEKWHELDRSEFDLKTKIENLRKNCNFIKNEIEYTNKNIKTSKADLRSLQKRVNILEGKEYEKKTDQLVKIKNKIKDFEKTRHENLVNLGGKKERITSLLLEQEETKALVEKLKIYNSIQNAFSKTGIPAMILKSQLPAINSELNKILDCIVDFSITLETDVKLNTMDVYIEDEHSKRIIELASGMEKTIASMALRVALINLTSLPKPDILILDEGFGALDEENIQSCMEMLTFLKGNFKAILIISHIPQIKEIADQLIEIKDNDSNSSVQVY